MSQIFIIFNRPSLNVSKCEEKDLFTFWSLASLGGFGDVWTLFGKERKKKNLVSGNNKIDRLTGGVV